MPVLHGVFLISIKFCSEDKKPTTKLLTMPSILSCCITNAAIVAVLSNNNVNAFGTFQRLFFIFIVIKKIYLYNFICINITFIFIKPIVESNY